jgi:hypothetical protein
VYRCLRAIIENVRFLKSELNPEADRDADALDSDKGLTESEVEDLIARALEAFESTLRFQARGGGGINVDAGTNTGDVLAWKNNRWTAMSAAGVGTGDQLEWDATTSTWKLCTKSLNPGASTNTVGSAAEGNEAAEGTTFTVDGTNGLKLYQCTRVGYFHGGDKKLYGYFRLLTFDRFGRLYSVGGETRVEIDAAVAEAT